MIRMASVSWSIVLLIALGGCAAHDAPPPAPTAAASAAPATFHAAVARSGQTAVPTPETGVRPSDSINRFPSHFGPVPQLRGQDKRPNVPVQGTTGQGKYGHKLGYATAAPAGTLVLYDTGATWGWLGELYAIASLNLASHFGATASKPVAQYQAGDMNAYQAVIYVGSTYDEPLPVAFLDDVLNATTTQVLWLYNNIWQLANRSPDFYTKYGYNPWMYDTTSITSVTYKGVVLGRDPLATGGIMQFSPFNAAAVTTLATATRADGTTLPWAVRSANLTYVGEIPYAYISHDDRYLAFCDLLFDVLAPTTATNYRALVRLEDVSPTDDAAEFRAVVDYLYSQSVPFSVAVIPQYTDPLGYYNSGKPLTVKWTAKSAAAMLASLKYATTKGGTLVLHGFTHQFGKIYNPYSGVSGDDFEFFRAHVDAATNNVIYDGAVSGDSATWATARVNSGLSALKTAGLPTPTIFEYPHYAGSPVDSKAIRAKIGTAYHRGLYFGGALGLTPQNLTHMIGQFFPYSVTDVFGWKLKPENLGNYEPEAYNNHPPRLAADLIKTAQNNRVVRDGVASFFFHPYNPISELKTIVQGVRAAGYTFVAANAL